MTNPFAINTQSLTAASSNAVYNLQETLNHIDVQEFSFEEALKLFPELQNNK